MPLIRATGFWNDGVVAGDDQVAHGREHHAGRDALALDRRDRRLGELVDAHALVEVHVALVAELALGRRPTLAELGVGVRSDELLEVVAGREVLAVGGEDHDAHRVVGVGAVEGARRSRRSSASTGRWPASGRSSVIVATLPSTSYRIVSNGFGSTSLIVAPSAVPAPARR